MKPVPLIVECPNCGRPIQVFCTVKDGPILDGVLIVKVIPTWDHTCPVKTTDPESATIAA
jgi:hypothetical protein